MRRSTYRNFALAVIFVSLGTFGVLAQSSDQNFPTPVTSSEIIGSIKARNIGDGRLTRYFYAFDGGQGDIFINVVTKNFVGDIDIFTLEALKPLTKMVIYPDSQPTETGRLIYLRRGERLLLRIEARTPNDDPATFRIKFGGSFIALAGETGNDAPTIKSTESEPDSGVRVNSVGTIIEVLPKAKLAKEASVEKATVITTGDKVQVEIPAPLGKADSGGERKKPSVIVTEAPEVRTVFGARREAPKNDERISEKKPEQRTTSNPKAIPPKKPTSRAAKATKTADAPVEKIADPLAGIHLIIQLKTGDVIQRPMSEVARFSVDKGVLTVIGKDGKTARYSILDVVKVTIE